MNVAKRPDVIETERVGKASRNRAVTARQYTTSLTARPHDLDDLPTHVPIQCAQLWRP